MVLAVILIKNYADPFGGGGGCGGGGGHTPLCCQIIIKSALNWLEDTNKNLWGGKSPTSPTQSGFAIAVKH